ncbi:unnamed protein product, partial [Polarella glacialis]
MDHDMPREVAVLAAKRKLERVAAFRQTQAISHQLYHFTQGRITIDHFVWPDNVHLQPVAPHEVRFVRDGDVQDVACVQGDEALKQVLPDDFVDVSLLVSFLDQGNIGAAGMAFAINELGMMMSCRFDKFHRLVRDMKLSLSHCCEGVFLKTQFFSSYIYGLNYKPFGTGGFSSLKQRLMQVFLATEDIHSEIWRKYSDRIGLDLGMPSSSDDDHQALFEAVASLPSFHHKLYFPKLGRWLSWNNSAHEYMSEFSATKMLFEHHLGEQPDPDEISTFNVDRDSILAAGRAANPRAELAALKNASGGLALAYKLMSADLQLHVKMLYTATQACWDWYTDQVKNVKTASDGFQNSVQMAHGRWAWSPHLWHTISHCLYNESSLEFMSMPGNLPDDPAVQKLAQKMLMLVWHLISHRGWTLTRHDCPPECYASIASANRLEAQATMDSTQGAWRRVIMLEQRLHDLPAARLLWADLDCMKSQPIRLLFAFFERDKWRIESLAGRKLLAGLLPDNKIVEDCHGQIRRESKANANQKLSISRIQDLVAWLERLIGGNHAQMCSGFRWLQNYVPGGPVKLDAALLSRLVLPFTLIQNNEGAVYASMGNASWAALAWPVSPVAAGADEAADVVDEAGMSCYAFDAEGSMTWIHVTNPSVWHVLPMAGARAAGGIVLKQIAEPVLLMHFFLANRKNPEPSYEELVMCAKRLNLEFDGKQPKRQELLRALADQFGDATIAHDEGHKPVVSVAADPLTEAIFDDMDKVDQMEFPEVYRSITQNRVRRRVAEWADLAKEPPKKVPRKKAEPKKRGRPHVVRHGRKRRRVAEEVEPAPPPVLPEPEAMPPESPDSLPPLPPPPPPPGLPGPPEPEALLVAAAVPPALLPEVPMVDVVVDGSAPGPGPAPAARRARAGAYGPATPWESVCCDVCHAPAGQIKLEPCPGQRDGPSWVMRTQDRAVPDVWPTQGPRYRARRTSVIGEAPTFARDWVQLNRICCPQETVDLDMGVATGRQLTASLRERLLQALEELTACRAAMAAKQMGFETSFSSNPSDHADVLKSPAVVQSVLPAAGLSASVCHVTKYTYSSAWQEEAFADEQGTSCSDAESVWRPGEVTRSSVCEVAVLLERASDDQRDEAELVVPHIGGDVRLLRRDSSLQHGEALRFDDLTEVPELHEAAVLQAVDDRFAQGRIYTLTGPVLLAVNPFRTMPGLFSPETMRSCAGSEKLQPHIFSVANRAYQGILRKRESQTVLVSGESGAGKTETTKFVIQFLALTGAEAVASDGEKPLSRAERQVLRSNPLLEAFGNAKTLRNDNSSRFGKYIELQFGTDEPRELDAQQRLVGVRIRTYLLETVRVNAHQEGERSFHIFYQVLAAAEKLRSGNTPEGWDPSLTELLAGLSGRKPSSFAALRPATGAASSSAADDTADFEATLAAMRTVGFSSSEVVDVLRVLSAVLQLGDLSFSVPARNSEASEVPAEATATLISICELLGLARDELHGALCLRTMQAPGEAVIRMANTTQQAAECCDALARHLYHAVFRHVVSKTNASIGFKEKATFCGVLDIFGFEFFKVNSFEQLCINFTNELLQQYFNSFIFENEALLYEEEGVPWQPQDFPDNAAIVALLQQSPGGVFPMLDE